MVLGADRYQRQTKAIREGAFRELGGSADGETQEEAGRSQPGSDPGEDSSKVTGKCTGGGLCAGSKGVDTRF